MNLHLKPLRLANLQWLQLKMDGNAVQRTQKQVLDPMFDLSTIAIVKTKWKDKCTLALVRPVSKTSIVM